LRPRGDGRPACRRPGRRRAARGYGRETTPAGECGQGPDWRSASGNPWALRASLTLASSKEPLSLRPNLNSRVLKSIRIVPCSTHGRVASASRTRFGQPTDQDIPGTVKATSNEGLPDPSFEAPPGGS